MDNFEKETLENTIDENVEQKDDTNVEEKLDFESEVFTAEKIYIPDTKSTVPESERKGLKVFCIILAITLLLSCFATGGYFLGKNSMSKLIGQTVDLQLEDKPVGKTPSDASDVYASVSQSIVGIFVYNEEGKAYNATGIVYTENGYIITADSVFANISSAKFKVYTKDKKEYSASFVAGDARSDIAVIKITDPVKLTPATLGDSSKALTGEVVYSVGCPNGYAEEAVISNGIISASTIRVASTITNYSQKMIQTTASVNPGAFGGALANEYGQIIGMLSTKNVSDGYEQSAYAVPTTTLKVIAESLIKNGKAPDRARIGISYIVKNSAVAEVEKLAAAGLQVADVSNESQLFNYLKKGDIIIKINGIESVTDETVLDIIEAASPGDSITLTVVTAKGTTADYSAKLLKYEGISSYTTILNSGNSNSSQNNGTFDFPEGY